MGGTTEVLSPRFSFEKPVLAKLDLRKVRCVDRSHREEARQDELFTELVSISSDSESCSRAKTCPLSAWRKLWARGRNLIGLFLSGLAAYEMAQQLEVGKGSGCWSGSIRHLRVSRIPAISTRCVKNKIRDFSERGRSTDAMPAVATTVKCLR